MATVADIANRLKARARHRHPAAKRLPALLLFSDEARLPDPMAALDRLPRGSGLVFRHYGLPKRAALARALTRKGRARGIAILIAGDARLAVNTRAAGLHLPEASLRDILAFGAIKQRKHYIITIAAHSLRSLFLAAKRGATAAVLGPVFPTTSHPGKPSLGPLRFARMCRLSPVPVYAIGGIAPGNVLRLKDSGAAGIAGIGAIQPPRPLGARGMALSRRQAGQ